MDDAKDAEWETNYINNLGREIVRECANIGLQVTPELVVHYIKLKVLNPRNGFVVTKMMSRELTQKFVTSCVNELSQVNPVADCIRMQAYWEAVSTKLDDVKLAYGTYLAEKSQAAFEELIAADGDEKLLRKIATFANIYTNIGNTNLSLNVRETMRPLKSVLKQKELEFFFSLTETGKFEYLKYIARLVSGIRVYQHYYKKGSENVDNAPLLLVNAASSIINDVIYWLEKISSRIRLLVKELYCVYQLMPGMVAQDMPEGFGEDDFVHLQQIHHIMIQHEIYLKEILLRLKEFNKATQYTTNKFVDSVEKLKETIGTREAIPTTEVYDQFTDICDQWSALRAESCYLICVGLIVKNLQAMNKYFPLTRLEIALRLTDSEPKIADEREKKRRIMLDTEGKKVELLKFTDETILNFHGFCALTLITTNGALLPARTELGIFKYENNYYGFLSAEAAELWRNNPDLNIRRAYEVIRRNPQLINLLDTYDYLYGFRAEVLVTDGEGGGATTQDRIVQTILQPVCTFRDKDYSFSEWQHKYKALQLSRIIKCVTKSVQTSNHSHFRASVGVQCKPDKTKGTDPRKDRGCVHESVRNYVRGLRGTSQFQVLDLTRPIRETGNERELCQSTRAQRKQLVNVTGREYTNTLKENNSLQPNDFW